MFIKTVLPACFLLVKITFFFEVFAICKAKACTVERQFKAPRQGLLQHLTTEPPLSLRRSLSVDTGSSIRYYYQLYSTLPPTSNFGAKKATPSSPSLAPNIGVRTQFIGKVFSLPSIFLLRGEAAGYALHSAFDRSTPSPKRQHNHTLKPFCWCMANAAMWNWRASLAQQHPPVCTWSLKAPSNSGQILSVCVRLLSRTLTVVWLLHRAWCANGWWRFSTREHLFFLILANGPRCIICDIGWLSRFTILSTFI